jgi:hypothetical protein
MAMKGQIMKDKNMEKLIELVNEEFFQCDNKTINVRGAGQNKFQVNAGGKIRTVDINFSFSIKTPLDEEVNEEVNDN